MFSYSWHSLVLMKESVVEMCEELRGSVKYIVVTLIEWLTGIQ